MTQTSKQVWLLLAESKLIGSDRLQDLAAESQRANPPDQTAEAVISWLVSEKAITEYQGRLIAAGRSGPFFYEEYEIRDRLTTGHFSGYYLALHVPTKYPVMLNFASPEQVADAGTWNHSKVRTNKHAEVSNPWGLRTYEMVDADAWKFIVCETRSGATIASRIEGGKRVNAKNSCHLMSFVADAINSLHNAGIIHGRISPDSLFIGTGGTCWVHCDPMKDGRNAEDDLPPEYRAPELAEADADGNPSAASDVYSIGCVLFQLLTGKILFAAEDAQQRLAKQLSGKIPSLTKAGFPQELADLVKAMLAPNPDQRPSSLAEISARLAAVAGTSIADIPPRESRRQAAYLKHIADKRTPLSPATAVTAEPDRAPSRPPNPAAIAPPVDDRSGKSTATENALPIGVQAVSSPTPPAAIRIDGALPASVIPSINPFEGTSGDPAPAPVPVPAPAIPTFPTDTPPADESVPFSQPIKVDASDTKLHRRRGSGWYKAIALLVSIAVFAPLGYFAVRELNSRATITNAIIDPSKESTKSASSESTDSENSDSTGGTDVAENPHDSLQIIVDDDGSRLWESPTEGRPLELKYVPDGIRVIISARPAELLKADDGELVLRSLGEQFAAIRTNLESKLGLPFKQIEHLLITVHDSEESSQLRSSYVVTLADPIPQGDLVSAWDKTVPTALDGTSLDYYLAANGSAYLIPEDELNTSEGIRRFVLSDKDQIETMSQFDFAQPNISANLRGIISKSDAKRHFSMITSSQFLTGPAAANLFMPPYDRLPDTIQWLFGRDFQSIVFSSHLEDDWYSEIVLRGPIDRDPNRLSFNISSRISEGSRLLGSYVSALPANPYWDRVRASFVIWISKMAFSSRYGVEDRTVVANCWMPRASAHNVIAASELVLAVSGSEATGTSTKVAQREEVGVPSTLSELLKSRHAVDIPEDDLINAVAEIKAGVLDKYRGSLPFEFDIVMLGTELQLAGITQNQKVLNFKHEAALEEILTRLVVTANPDPNSTGPSDPLNKLVWVIGPDPKNPEREVILITTRAGAAKAEIDLPGVFVAED